MKENVMNFENVEETTKAVGLFCVLFGTLTGIWKVTLFGGCAILIWRTLNEYAYEGNWSVALKKTLPINLTAVVVAGVSMFSLHLINRHF
jgi:hypothetical protein